MHLSVANSETNIQESAFCCPTMPHQLSHEKRGPVFFRVYRVCNTTQLFGDCSKPLFYKYPPFNNWYFTESKGPPSFFVVPPLSMFTVLGPGTCLLPSPDSAKLTKPSLQTVQCVRRGLRWLGGTPQLMLVESIQLSFPKKPSANATAQVPKPFRFQSKNNKLIEKPWINGHENFLNQPLLKWHDNNISHPTNIPPPPLALSPATGHRASRRLQQIPLVVQVFERPQSIVEARPQSYSVGMFLASEFGMRPAFF